MNPLLPPYYLERMAREDPDAYRSEVLGEFRAGAVAALFGAFTSVLVGGVGAIAVALLWMKLFPELRRIDTIEGKAD